MGKIPSMSPIVINVPTRALMAVETKGLFFLWLANLNNKSNACQQISFPFRELDIYLCEQRIVNRTKRGGQKPGLLLLRGHFCRHAHNHIARSV